MLKIPHEKYFLRKLERQKGKRQGSEIMRRKKKSMPSMFENCHYID